MRKLSKHSQVSIYRNKEGLMNIERGKRSKSSRVQVKWSVTRSVERGLESTLSLLRYWYRKKANTMRVCLMFESSLYLTRWVSWGQWKQDSPDTVIVPHFLCLLLVLAPGRTVQWRTLWWKWPLLSLHFPSCYSKVLPVTPMSFLLLQSPSCYSKVLCDYDFVPIFFEAFKNHA